MFDIKTFLLINYLLNRLRDFFELPEHQPREDGLVAPGSIKIRNANVCSFPVLGNIPVTFIKNFIQTLYIRTRFSTI